MMTPKPHVSLHRFHEYAALAITDADGPTVYLDVKKARRLASDLMRLCRSIERETYGSSSYRQESIEASFVTL